MVGTSLRSRHPEVAKEVGEQLKRAMDVHQIVEKVRLGKANQEEISNAMKLVERLEKKRKTLFKGKAFEKKYHKHKEEHRRRLLLEAEQQKREEERKQKEAHEEEKRAFQQRRAKQLRFAGHPSARTIKFSKLKHSEHATFRCNDRLQSMTLPELLDQIDEARLFYRLYPCNAKGEPRWEVQVCPQMHDDEEEAEAEDNEDKDKKSNEEVTLILDKSKTTIITVLRDDEDYDFEICDREYAAAGIVARDRALEGVE